MTDPRSGRATDGNGASVDDPESGIPASPSTAPGQPVAAQPVAAQPVAAQHLAAEHVAELLSAISHDLRTPLGVMTGAFREVRDSLPAPSATYVRLIDRSGERLHALADRLTRASAAISRRPVGEKPVARSSVVLRDAAQRASTRLEAPVRIELGSDVDVALDGPRATEALAELMRLAQAAADPAVRVTSSGRHIEVRVLLESQPAAGHEIERSFDTASGRARVNLELYFARIELESQGCSLALEPGAKAALLVRIPLA